MYISPIQQLLIEIYIILSTLLYHVGTFIRELILITNHHHISSKYQLFSCKQIYVCRTDNGWLVYMAMLSAQHTTQLDIG